MNYLFKALSVKYLIFFFAISSVSAGCTNPSVEEISRATSPDSIVDAVLLRKNYHATVPFIFEIYITPKGSNVDQEKEIIFSADHVEDLTMTWKNTKRLEITYASARIGHFKNWWMSKKIDNFKYVVEINLQQKPQTK